MKSLEPDLRRGTHGGRSMAKTAPDPLGQAWSRGRGSSTISINLARALLGGPRRAVVRLSLSVRAQRGSSEALKGLPAAQLRRGDDLEVNMVVQACRWRDIDGVICALPRSDGAQYCPAHTLWVARSQCHDCGFPDHGPFCQFHQEVAVRGHATGRFQPELVCAHGACLVITVPGTRYCWKHRKPESPVLKRFYLILNEDRLTNCGRDENFQQISREATRLAHTRPNEKFLIFQLLSSVTLPSDVSWENVEP